jgi:hypothetical protein
MTSFYNKQCQQIVSDYRVAGGAWPPKKIEIVEWALERRRWAPSPEDIRRMCGEAIAEAMREDAFTDESGRPVRAMLNAKTVRNGEQGVFWDYLRTAPVEFVRIGVAQRRNGIVAECYHLNNMVRYFNEHHSADEQIPLSLEFAKDVLELDQPRRAGVSGPSSTSRSKPSAQPRRAPPLSISPREPVLPSSRPRARV